MHASRSNRIGDALCATALAFVTLLYLSSLPRNLGAVDEANFIYEAQRVANGETMYRDVFEVFTPLSIYSLAFVLRVFGSDMGVARGTIAVVHAIIVIMIFACARRLGARTSVAGAAALAHLAIAQPAWAYVSYHWFGAAGNILVFLALLSCPWLRQPRWALVPGLLTGILIGIQQQKGVPIAIGACIIFGLAPFVARRVISVRAIATQILFFALGVVAIMGPVLLYVVATAGVAPVVEALITFPLVNYRGSYRSAWGGMQLFTAYYGSFTFPMLLKWSPLIVVPLALRVTWQAVQSRDPETVVPLLTCVVFAVFTVASIAYYPDIIHIAFIVPVFLVIAAEAIEWLLHAVPSAGVARAAGVLIALCCVAAIVWHLRGNRQRLWTMFSIPHQTAFGRMDFNEGSFLPVIDKLRELLATAPVKEIFCYPSISGPYLWSGANNPTRYQFFSPTYNTREQAQEIIARLEERETPFVVTSPLGARKDDPIMQYVLAHYEVVRFGFLPKIWLYQRTTPARHAHEQPPH